MRDFRGMWLCGAFVVALVCGKALAASDGKSNDPKDVGAQIDIVIKGEPTAGWIVLPATETEFKFKLFDTGDIITFRWADLEEPERKRVQKLYGLEVHDDMLVFGPKIQGMRYSLESGKQVEGLPLPERSRPGEIALRTASAPYMVLNLREIKSQEPIDREESYFYSAREIYERMLQNDPPGNTSAAKHLEYARVCGNMGLFQEALNHLTKAEIIDPRTVERNRDFRQELINKHAEQEGLKLYNQLTKAMRAEDFFEAMNVLDRLDRGFPNHSYRSRWESLRPQIEEGCKTNLNKKVIQFAYTIANDLVQQRLFKKIKVDEKGNLIDSIPGKQVTTKHDRIFRGTLTDPDPDGNLILQLWDPNINQLSHTMLTIKQKEILSVQDVDLSGGSREITPSFDELKQYASDTGGKAGLKGQMVARITQLLKGVPGLTEAKVREIFDARLQKTGVVDETGVKLSATYTTLHSASYGVGSWLREGSRVMPYNGPDRTSRSSNGQPYVNGNLSTNANAAAVAAASNDDNPETTDDPEVWWKFQSNETKLNILRAIMAEKIFSARAPQRLSCPECGNRGQIQIPGPGGAPIFVRCPLCRGQGVLFKLDYE